MTEGKSVKNYNSIDLAKFICAILVVAIHVAPFWKLADEPQIFKYLNYFIMQYVARIGVPLFFVFTGYFLFRKITDVKNALNVLQNSIRKYIYIYNMEFNISSSNY